MDITFKVQWRRLWKNLTIYMSIAIIVPVAFFVALRWMRLGYEETFRHASPLGIMSFPVGIIAFCTACSLAIASVCRLMSVRITDKYLEGRNYWGIKKRLPLDEIMSMSRFDSSGIHAVVVSAGKRGKVYILDQTESIHDLVALLATYQTEKKTEPESGSRR